MLALCIILGLIALIVLALLVPVELALEGELGALARFDVRFVWLFGLVRARLNRPQKKRAVPRRVTKKKTSAAESLRRSKIFLQVLRTEGLVRQAARFMRGVIRSVQVREVKVDLDISLGDPADTGMLFAVLGPFMALIEAWSPHTVVLQPAMVDSPTVNGYCRGNIRVVPMRIAGHVLRFVFSAPARRMLKLMIGQRWKSRD